MELMLVLVAIGLLLALSAALAEVLPVVSQLAVIISVALAAWYLTGPHKVAETVKAVLAAEPLPPPPPPWEGCECQCDVCRSIPPKHGHSVLVEVASGKIILGGSHSPAEIAYAAWSEENRNAWKALGPDGRAFRSAQLDWSRATDREYARRRDSGDPDWRSWLPPRMPRPPRTTPPPEPGFVLKLLRRVVPEHYAAYAAGRTVAWEAQCEEMAGAWRVKVEAEIPEWEARWEREAAEAQARRVAAEETRTIYLRNSEGVLCAARPMTLALARVLHQNDGIRLMRGDPPCTCIACRSDLPQEAPQAPIRKPLGSLPARIAETGVAEPGWLCPTHRQATVKTSSRRNRQYRACPVAGCGEFERL
jgi:hypothetical protein